MSFRLFCGEHRKATTLIADLFCNFVISHSFRVMGYAAQHFKVRWQTTACVKRLKTIQIRGQQLWSECDGELAIALVRSGEAVHGCVLESGLAQLQRRRRS